MMKLSQSEDRNLIIYFIVACGFTWAFWIPEALATRGILGPSFILGPNNPAAWGPLVAAFSLTFLKEGKNGVMSLLRRAVDIGFGKVWWVPILILFPGINGVALFLAKLC